MISFSQFEKDIIKDMIALDKEAGGTLVCLQNIINKSSSIETSSDYYIKVSSPDKACIMVKAEANEYHRLKEVDKNFALNILPCALLLNKLEEEKLIFSMGEDDKSILGDCCKKGDYIRYKSMGSNVEDLVFRYSRKNFYITEDLKEIEKKDFMAEADIRHQKEIQRMDKSIRISRWGVGVSILAIFLSIIANAIFAYASIFGTSSVSVVSMPKKGDISEKCCKIPAETKSLIYIIPFEY